MPAANAARTAHGPEHSKQGKTKKGKDKAEEARTKQNKAEQSKKGKTQESKGQRGKMITEQSRTQQSKGKGAKGKMPARQKEATKVAVGAVFRVWRCAADKSRLPLISIPIRIEARHDALGAAHLVITWAKVIEDGIAIDIATLP